MGGGHSDTGATLCVCVMSALLHSVSVYIRTFTSSLFPPLSASHICSHLPHCVMTTETPLDNAGTIPFSSWHGMSHHGIDVLTSVGGPGCPDLSSVLVR